MDNNISFQAYFKEYLDIKHMSPQKLTDLSGVPQRYIEALLEGNFRELPPNPYVRGYIGKIAEVLEFDRDEMWSLYKKEVIIENTNGFDRLPSNRFATRNINKKTLGTLLIVGIVALYITLNFKTFVGSPALEITYPTNENLVVRNPLITLEGRTDGNNTITLNQSDIFVDTDGLFKKEYQLNPGLNVIEITAKKFLGKEVTIIRNIVYQPIEEFIQDNATSTILFKEKKE